MMRRLSFLLWAVALTNATALGTARAEGTLRVCLDEDVPIYSVHHGSESNGFDLAVAQAIAKRLDATLSVQWYESRIEEDSSTILDANALLSDGRCQLFAGYALIRDALGKPHMASARLPDHEGIKPGDRRRRVQLGTLIPTKPYHQAAMTVILGGAAASKKITGFGDLYGIKIGVEGGTLADAILMTFHDGQLVEQITHLVPGRNQLMPRLENGDFEATLVDSRRFDAWRAEHPDTKLKASGFYYHLAFNIGFVALSTEGALVERVNAAIADMTAKGELADLAKAAGMTYLPAKEPDVLERLTMEDLQGE